MLAAYFYTRVSQAIEELNANAELKTVEAGLRELGRERVGRDSFRGVLK